MGRKLIGHPALTITTPQPVAPRRFTYYTWVTMRRRAIILGSLLTLPLLLGADEAPFKVTIIAAPAPFQTYKFSGFQFKDNQTVWGTILTLKQMIEYAYHVTDEQIIGGRAWTTKELFDVTANAGRPMPMADLEAMLQTMLAERFHLKVHRESRMLPAYVLTLDKSGSKLLPSAKPDGFEIPVRTVGPGKRPGTIALQSMGGSIPEFSLVLGRLIGRPVVDRTGLDQFYNFKLEFMLTAPFHQEQQRHWTPDGPYVFGALREQLGLRLDSKKVTVDVLVIDHAEKPTLDRPTLPAVSSSTNHP